MPESIIGSPEYRIDANYQGRGHTYKRTVRKQQEAIGIAKRAGRRGYLATVTMVYYTSTAVKEQQIHIEQPVEQLPPWGTTWRGIE